MRGLFFPMSGFPLLGYNKYRKKTREVSQIMEITGIIFTVILVSIIVALAIYLLCIACETTKEIVIGSIIVILVAILITASAILCANENKKVWNNGYCECGGKWKLVAVSDTDRGSRTKYYVCDECYKEITQ